MRRYVFAVLFLVLCPFLIAQQGMNNDAVVKMVKAGLSDDVIVSTINASAGAYDTSADGIIALKTAGASDKVIAAIVIKSAGATPAATATHAASANPAAPGGLPHGVSGVGVYFQDTNGAWQEILPDLVNYQSAGALKHLFTATLIKEDCNGIIAGGRSRLLLKTPATFILFLSGGKTPEQYELLQLHVNGTTREFQYAAGNLGHQTGGAVRDNVGFSSTKIDPSAYQIVLGPSTKPGEYGLLEPQDTSSQKNPPTTGKIYSFSIVQ